MSFLSVEVFFDLLKKFKDLNFYVIGFNSYYYLFIQIIV